MTTQLARPAIPARQWNTLQILKAGRAAILALDALLLIAILIGTDVHYRAMKSVGKDTAPSIIAAQHIKSALADMDAGAANELLGPARGSVGIPKDYEDKRVEAAKALIEAAENITFGESERQPILSLQVQMGTYERLVQRARDLHQANSLHQLNNADTIAAYREAAKVMDSGLLPAAEALDKANNKQLEDSYRAQSSKSTLARAFILIAGLVSLAALLYMQIFLSRHMRRTFNPLLLLATLLTFGLAAYSLFAMSSEQHELKVAKEDAFASIHALWQARAIAYEANSDESRYLLDTQQSAEDQSAFVSMSDLLAKLPPGMTMDQLLAAERNGDRVDGFFGLLADELNNVTFNGEREQAIKTLVSFERYLDIDAEIRRLERAGQHQKAIDLCLGTAEGQSDWAFAEFNRDLSATLEINKTAFDGAVANGFAAVSELDVKASVIAALIAVLMFLGLAGRIREYQ